MATFTDGNASAPASDFTATISWGDGQATAGVVTKNGSIFTVTGTHIYDEGVYDGGMGHGGAIKVTIVDVGGSTLTVPNSATVPEGVAALGGGHGNQTQNYVNEVYQSVAGRDPDLAALNFWTTVLTNGSSTKPQFVAALTGEATGDPTFRRNTVRTLYRQLLHRDADASGLDF